MKLLKSLEQNDIAELQSSPSPRKRSPSQLQKLKDSVSAFALIPVIDEKTRILAGHGRAAAARLVRLAALQTIVTTDMTEAQKRAYVMEESLLAELADLG